MRTNTKEFLNDLVSIYKNGIETSKRIINNSKPVKIIVDGEERELKELEKEKLNNSLKSLIEKTEKEINNKINDFALSEKNFFTLKGEKLTDDIKLFEIGLSENQIRELANKYKDNFTMYTAINNKAKERGIVLKPLQSSEERQGIISSFNNLINARFIDTVLNYEAKTKFPFDETAEKLIDNYSGKFYEL